MKTSSLAISYAVLLAGCALSLSARSQADSFPSKPIRIVVPFAPGSGADLYGRYYGDLLSKALKTPIIVENRPGANGAAGMQFLKTSPSDGYTIAVISPSFVVTPLMYASTTYKTGDFKPLAGIAKGPIGFFTRADSKFSSLNDALKAAATEKRSLAIATYAGSYQIGAAWLSMLSGVPVLNVPYRGATQAVTDLLGGSVEVMSSDFNAMVPLMTEGKIKPLAVAAATRLPSHPSVPTVNETYKGYENYIWIGLVVRSDTPQVVVDKLSAAMQKILASSESKDFISRQGWETMALDSKQMANYLLQEEKRYANVVKVAHIKPE